MSSKLDDWLARRLATGPAQEAWEQYAAETLLLRKKFRQQLAELRGGLLEAVERARDAAAEEREFETAADLQLAMRRLAGPAMGAAADPYNVADHRGSAGESFLFRVVGTTEGSVWGTDVYADDSRLAAAAVHAGVLADGESGVVKILILDFEGPYTGSKRNGVASRDYAKWSGAFRFEIP